jgi:hypothetical protein
VSVFPFEVASTALAVTKTVSINGTTGGEFILGDGVTKINLSNNHRNHFVTNVKNHFVK